MLAQCKSVRSGSKLITISLASLISFSAMADSFSIEDSVMRGIEGLTEADLQVSKAFGEMARKEERSSSTDYGRLKKLWCESALIAPDAENLAGCARGRYGAFFSASNPQISRQEAAKTSLGYIRAGLEIAGTKTDLSDDFRTSIRDEALCLFAIANGEDRQSDCPAPYDR